MKQYILASHVTEQDLIDNGFMYRKHYDNYMFINSDENGATLQDLYIEVDFKTKEVDVFIRTLNGHRNQEFVKRNIYNIHVDIYPLYIEVILNLINKGIVVEIENE